MFGSEVLEVGIGMALLFLFASLIATAAQEALESLLKTRAGDLERGIRELLNDPKGTGLAKQLYEHPLIASLYPGGFDPKYTFGRASYEGRQTLPSYIPSPQFASALIDILARGAPPAPRPDGGAAEEASSNKGAAVMTYDSLRGSVDQIQDPRIRRVLLSALDQSKGDLDEVRRSIEAWFDGTMDRVAGWYKRRSQNFLFLFGLGTAVLLNVDAVTVASRLLSDPKLRQTIVAQAEIVAARPLPSNSAPGAGAASAEAPKEEKSQGRGVAPQEVAPAIAVSPPAAPASEGAAVRQAERTQATPPTGASPSGSDTVVSTNRDLAQLTSDFQNIGFPIGWPPPQLRTCETKNGQTVCIFPGREKWVDWWIVPAIPGWLMTALAIMLGAPFWFDVLNKFMVIRSTVKPTEKSPTEGSEDRADHSSRSTRTLDRAPSAAKPSPGAGLGGNGGA